MRKVKKIGIISLVLAIGLIAAGCALMGERLPLPEEVSYGVFIQNPAPPVCKEITDADQLKELLSILKEANATKIDDASEKNRLSAQGWSAWIRLISEADDSHNTLDTAWSIAIYGEDVLNVEKTFYQVPESTIQALLQLYEESAAQEQDYNDYLSQIPENEKEG